jgi:hypothetical protein
MSEILLSLLFNRKPCTPVQSKWTKVGPVVDFILTSNSIHGCLKQVFAIAARALKFTSKAVAQGLDEQLAQDLDFNQIAGSRCNSGKLFLKCNTSRFKLALLGIVMEPLRYLTRCFIMCAKSSRDNARAPPLLDMLHRDLSPLTAALQYLAGLLCSSRSRDCDLWQLLYRWQGFADVDEWMAQRPGELRLTRRIILLASSWVYRRHLVCFQDWPWALCSLADVRVPESQHADIVSRWDSMNMCCVPPGFAASLKRRGITGDMLRTPRPQRFELLAFPFVFESCPLSATCNTAGGEPSCGITRPLSP